MRLAKSMNNKNVFVLGVVMLNGCVAAGPAVGPWGYDFTVVRVEDARPNDDVMLMAATPFTSQKLIEAWQRAVPRPGWGAQPAELAMRVTHYQATHSGSSYALSLKADMVGRAGEPAPSYRPTHIPIVAQVSGQCAVQGVSGRGRGQTALAKQVIGINTPQGGAQSAPTGLAALTVEGRDATLWEELWTQCTAQMATQLGNALLAAPPHTVPDTRGR